MKKIMCIMLMFCFCLAGFAVGRRSVDVYLNQDEAIYVAWYDNNPYVWLYTFNPCTNTWDLERVVEHHPMLSRINVHFVEPIVY